MGIKIFHRNKYWTQGINFFQQDINEIYMREYNLASAKKPPVNIILLDRETLHSVKDNFSDDTVFIRIHDAQRQKNNFSYSDGIINLYINDTPKYFIKKLNLIIKNGLRCGWKDTESQFSITATLSERERLVITELVNRLTPELISSRNKIDIKYISYYKRSAMRKLNVSTTHSLLHIFHQGSPSYI